MINVAMQIKIMIMIMQLVLASRYIFRTFVIFYSLFLDLICASESSLSKANRYWIGAAIGLERTACLETCETSLLKRGKYKMLIYSEISWFVILVCGGWWIFDLLFDHMTYLLE